VLKIENEVAEIPQSVGVCQGDNMAHVLFLFLMTAFAQTLELEWKKLGIPILSVMTAGIEHLPTGKSEAIHQKCRNQRNESHTKYCNASMLMTALSHLVQERTCDVEWN
jgi:hypothetical protein